MNKFFLCFTCFLFFLLTSPICKGNGKCFDRHYVILVDQTKDVQNSSQIMSIYQALEELFCHNCISDTTRNALSQSSQIPTNFVFNPQTDEISLYGFGLPGESDNDQFCNIYGTFDYFKYKARYHKLPDDLLKAISNALIQGRGTFSESGLNLNDFMQWHVKPIFNHEDSLCNNMSRMSGVTLSHYVYPLIINHFDTKNSATEYIVIVVSNYMSGLYDSSSSKDRNQLRDMLARKDSCLVSLEGQINKLKSPFNDNDYFELSKDGFKDNDKIVAKAFKVTAKALNGVSLYIASNIEFAQMEYQGSQYRLNPVEISFNHDKNLVIDSICQSITSNENVKNDSCIAKGQKTEGIFNSLRKIYLIGEQELNLGGRKSGDKINVEYVFYTRVVDDSGKTLLPYTFKTNRNVILGDDVFKESDEKKVMITDICIAFSLLLLVIILLIARKARGKKAPIKVDFKIWPISNSRFQDVKDMKVIDYDCWYWFGDNDRQRNIQITGNVKLVRRIISKNYTLGIKYRIEDADQNESFSFRPVGNENDGSLRKKNEWYDTPVSQNGNFEILCSAYLEDNLTPDFGFDNILKLKVLVKPYLVDNKGRVVSKRENEVKDDYYSFIVKPQIDNESLWVAFDPGTTGSCIAYGAGGNPDQNDNINIAENLYQELDGTWRRNTIFPSKIKITDDSRAYKNGDVTNFIEEKDYLFGNQAVMLEGANTFQSIKKLLGYSNKLPIKNKYGEESKISGEDIAHLLVKGLCNHFKRYIKTDLAVDDQFKNKFFRNGVFSPSRAIMAVPNNYTMLKVQAMIDTVKRLNLFKEVHYIYESEGVLMEYLHRNWSNLDRVKDKLIVVFDMGGATINATAFCINVTKDKNNGHEYVRNVVVKTMSKIGYNVGGDDIDFTLVKFILGIPSVKSVIKDKESKIMKQHKKALIDFARKFKLSYIEKESGRRIGDDNILISNENLLGSIRTMLEPWGFMLPTEKNEDDETYINKEMNSHNMMKRFVFSNVEDAVIELLNGLKENNAPSEVELIFSGRSTLYPGIKEAVINTINNKKYHCKAEWDGFSRDGRLDDVLVKTCVVRGACWYAMFSKYITMEHDIVTSTFGYMDMVDDKSKFVPVVSRNMTFDEQGLCKNEVEPIHPMLDSVQFKQMFGFDCDKIIREDIRHKKVDLVNVQSDQLRAQIKKIAISIDNKNNFTYQIDMAGMNPVCGSYIVTDADITDENSEAYSFAAIPCAEDQDEIGTRIIKKHF